MWHASISFREGPRALLTNRWTRQQRNEAERIARRMLDGVGQAPERVEVYPLGLHVKRCLTDAELEGLTIACPIWAAEPAVDEAGTPEQIEASLIQMGILRRDRHGRLDYATTLPTSSHLTPP